MYRHVPAIVDDGLFIVPDPDRKCVIVTDTEVLVTAYIYLHGTWRRIDRLLEPYVIEIEKYGEYVMFMGMLAKKLGNTVLILDDEEGVLPILN